MNEPVERRPASGTELPEFFQHLKTLVLAVMDDRGLLVEANDGFLRLLEPEPPRIGVDVSPFFINPSFASLVRRDAEVGHPNPDRARGFAGSAQLYRGIITIGRPDRGATSVRGEVRRTNGKVVLVAEHDIEDLATLANEMIAITDRMAREQRELVKAKKELQRREAQLQTLAATDPLTGLANRRLLDERLDAEIERSKRMGTDLSVVILDLDHFKEFNDTWGHLCGDRCLEGVASILRESSRPYDTAARFGGEEFVLIMPGVDLAAARIRADEIRMAIAAAEIPGTAANVTASLGVAAYRGESATELLHHADQALYAAKDAGRNRVAVAGESLDP